MSNKDGSIPSEPRPEKIVITDQAAADAIALEISESLLIEKEPLVSPTPEPVVAEQPEVSPKPVRPAKPLPVAPEARVIPKETESGNFKLPKPGEGALLYHLNDEVVYRVFCISKGTGKRSGKEFFIQPADNGRTPAKQITRAELLKRGVEEGWKYVGADTIQGAVETEVRVPSVPKSGKEVIALDKLKVHLKGIVRGERARYSDRDGLERVIEKVSDQSFFIMRWTDQGDGKNKSQLYRLDDLAELILNERWRFQEKEKIDISAEPKKENTPLGPGLESAKKIEKRLSDLAPGMKLVYQDDSNEEVTIVANPEKQKEFLDVRFPRNMDEDFPEASLKHSYEEVLGDTKVFRVVRKGAKDSFTTLSDIAETIYRGKWKFQHGGEFVQQRADPVAAEQPVIAPEFLREGEEAEFEYPSHDGAVTVKLRREKGQYILIHSDGTTVETFSEEEIRVLAQSQGFLRRLPETTTHPVQPATPEAVPSAPDHSEFLTLPEGQSVRYTNKFFGVVIILERRGDQFQITDEKGDESGFVYDAEHIARVAAKEEWQRQAEAPRSVEVAPVSPETPEQAAFRAQMDAEVAALRNEVNTERSAYVAKEQEQSGAWNRLSKLLHIEKRETDNKEILEYKGYYENALMRWKNASLERLKHLGLDREALREEMAALIREIEFEESDRLYDERLKLRMEKTSAPAHKRMKELWEETRDAATTNAYFEDRETGHYVQKEVIHRNWLKLMVEGSAITGQATMRGVKKTGEAWSKITKGRAGKYILAASLAGAGAVAFGVTGGGTLVGALALKRALSGAATFAGTEKLLNTIAKESRERKKERFYEEDRVQNVLTDVEVATAAEMNLEGGSRMPNLDALSKYLDEEGIDKIHDKAKLRKHFSAGRRAAAIVAGAVVGGMIPKEWLPFSSSHAAASVQVGPNGELSTATAVLREAAVAPEAAASAAASVDTAVSAPAGAIGAVGTPTPGVAALAETERAGAEHVSTERGVTLAARLKELTSTHTVGKGESIWKIATDSVKDVPDMDKRSTTRFAKLLELKLQEKLTVIDPKVAEAAGFTVDANGNFTPSHIQLGAKLELGKLIPGDEMAKLIEEAKGDSPITLAPAHLPAASVVEGTPIPVATEAVVVEPTEAERIAIDEARIDAAVPISSADERAEVLGQFSMSTELVGPKGDVMRYVGTLPREEQEHLFRNFRRITTGLFQTNEVMGGNVYDMNYDPSLRPELSKTYISRVLGDHKLLHGNPFTAYDRLKNPLHGSQMESVAKFAKAAAKTFGQSVAEPRATESVQEYVLRMVAIAENQKVKIPGFRMVN